MPRENKTKYAVLGLLAYAPLSGYDIRRIYAQSLGNFWSESYGHIYPILKRLEDEGLATREVQRQTGKPDRNVYTITDAGPRGAAPLAGAAARPAQGARGAAAQALPRLGDRPATSMIEHVKQTVAPSTRRCCAGTRTTTRRWRAHDEPPTPYWLHDRELRPAHQQGLHRLVRRDARQAGAAARGAAGAGPSTGSPTRTRHHGGDDMTPTARRRPAPGRRAATTIRPWRSLHDALVDGLAAGGWAVDDWRLRDEKIAWCAGCFGAGRRRPACAPTRTPGARSPRAWVRSDLLVYLTPVTFGGYSSELKKALDHVIPHPAA